MYYRVKDYDGLGMRNFTAAWEAEETRSRVERLGGTWDPEGGSVDYGEYNAGTEHLPNWRYSTLTWEPINE